MSTSLMNWSERLGKTQARVLRFELNITGAKAASPIVPGAPILSNYDAFASQAAINTYLGTTNEFLLAAFDATAMGTDAFGGVIALDGQCARVTRMEVSSFTGTGGLTEVTRTVAAVDTLTASSLTTQVARGANGNVGFRAILPGVDALTSGLIIVELYWISK